MPSAKGLHGHVVDGTFRARRHHGLLESDGIVPDPRLGEIQLRYRATEHVLERRRIAVEFERAVGEYVDEQRTDGRGLDAELAKLGPKGSAKRALGFFPRFLRHVSGPKAGQAFKLERFQREWTSEFLERDRHGRRVYTVGLFGGPKGTGKTPWGAGLCLEALASNDDAPECYSIAGSKDQARLAHRFANVQCEEGELAAWLRPGSELRRRGGPGFYKVLSSDGRLGQGVIPTRGFGDEGWLLRTDRERETVNALRQALHKRDGEADFFAMSTAGWPGGWLWEMYEQAIKHPRLEVMNGGFLRILRDRETGFLMHWYGLPDDFDGAIDDPKVVRACNPAPWIRPASLIKQLHQPGQDELDWLRLNANAWTKVRGAWPAASRFRHLATSARPASGAAIWIGMDGAQTYDTTAVTWVGRGPDGIPIFESRVFTVRPELIAQGLAHVLCPGEQIDNEKHVEPFVHELASGHRIAAIVYDPRYLASEAKHLADRGFPVIELNVAAAPARDAVSEFIKAVGVDGLRYADTDRVLRGHVEGVEGIRDERGWRISKLHAASPIDAAVAGCYAHWGLLNVPELKPWVFVAR